MISRKTFNLDQATSITGQQPVTHNKSNQPEPFSRALLTSKVQVICHVNSQPGIVNGCSSQLSESPVYETSEAQLALCSVWRISRTGRR